MKIKGEIEDLKIKKNVKKWRRSEEEKTTKKNEWS